MGLLTSVLGLDSAKQFARHKMARYTANFIDLETAITRRAYLTKTGSLLTVIDVKGLTDVIGKEEILNAQSNLAQWLEENQRTPGVDIEWVVDVNSKRRHSDVKRMIRPLQETAKRLNLDVDDILEGKAEKLTGLIKSTKTYVAIWTSVAALGSSGARIASQNNDVKSDQLKGNPKTNTDNGANTIRLMPEVVDKHNALVESTERMLKTARLKFETLDVHTAGRAMRGQLEPHADIEAFNPILLGDKYTPRYNDGDNTESIRSGALPPRVDQQLLTKSAFPTSEDPTICKVGDTYFQSYYTSLMPSEFMPMHILEREIPNDCSYRMSFTLSSASKTNNLANEILMSFVFWGSKRNGLINDSLKNMRNEGKEHRCTCQIHITPYGETLSELKRSRQQVESALNVWGDMQMRGDTVDPIESYVRSAVGVSQRKTDMKHLPRIDEMALLNPFMRPASQWDTGSVFMTSDTQDLMPHEIGASNQEWYANAICAQPRNGKSVLANAMLLSACLQGNLSRLPRVAAADVGNSTEGYTTMLRESLPQDMQYQVQHSVWQLKEEYTKNPFDIMLGAVKPNPQERSFLINFIDTITSEPGEKSVDQMSNLISLAIDAAYDFALQPENIKKYTEGMHPKLDVAIKDHEIEVKGDKTTYLEIRDQFFEKGLIREAQLAQSLHVPTLKEFPMIVKRSDRLTNNFKELISTFESYINAAVRNYANIGGHTQLDMFGARVMSIDLTYVAPKGNSGPNLKQTSLMYMLATNAMAGDYMYDESVIGDMPAAYQAYHKKELKSHFEDPKYIQWDEFHRPAHSPQILTMVEGFLAEGPKYRIYPTVISQQVSHFGRLLSLFSNKFLLGSPESMEIDAITKETELSEAALHALKHRAEGPGPKGSSLLHIMSTNDGKFVQFLRYPAATTELWALGTSNVDKKLRAEMKERYGLVNARKLLAEIYPSGTVKSIIDKMRAEQNIPEEEALSLVDTVFKRTTERVESSNLLDKVS